jgi:very-short-patch-repair endonuclease
MDKDSLNKARQLRQHATDAEMLLWSRLRNRQLLNHKFRRQVPVGNYIADFVCLALKLIVDIDGGQHAERPAYDERRTAWLESKGYSVVRFWNNEVLRDLDGVVEALTPALSRRGREIE